MFPLYKEKLSIMNSKNQTFINKSIGIKVRQMKKKNSESGKEKNAKPVRRGFTTAGN